MKRASSKPWSIRTNNDYRPKISIIVPTYNESSIILFKLINLSRVRYPENLMEVIVVDSNSCDSTIDIVRRFFNENSRVNFKILVEEERKGKSHALNYALNHCEGDIIIVSDADCFWPSDVLEKAIPFLADPSVGAISGPKILLNAGQTWVTRMEEAYLKSANVLRLGESKSGSTVFFEGGFSAFKREAFERFDPYETGSDDCGTVIHVLERNFKAILVPEARFFSMFPASFCGKLVVKSRRANQLVRVFAKYLASVGKKGIVVARRIIIPNVILYLFSPLAFTIFLIFSLVLLMHFPLLLAASALLIVPSVRFYLYEIFESNFILFAAIFAAIFGKKFSVWGQPEDRTCITKDVLIRFNLV
ncbi:MAG: glycosyltransferase [Candidatus Bathyarchaeia archaeon]